MTLPKPKPCLRPNHLRLSFPTNRMMPNSFSMPLSHGGGVPVIPPRSNRKTLRDYDKHLYHERHRAKCFMNKIKH